MGLLKSKGRVEHREGQGPTAGRVGRGHAREKVSPYAEKAVERGAAVAHAAVEKAGPVIDDALSKVGPATEHAAEKARERFNDDLLPKVTAALATLAAAAEPVIEESSRRGKATKAALRGELEVPKKSHKLRKVVLFLGFGALAAAAVKKLLTPPEPAWQSTPTSGRDYSSAPAASDVAPRPTRRPKQRRRSRRLRTAETDDEPETAKSDDGRDRTSAKRPTTLRRRRRTAPPRRPPRPGSSTEASRPTPDRHPATAPPRIPHHPQHRTKGRDPQVEIAALRRCSDFRIRRPRRRSTRARGADRAAIV